MEESATAVEESATATEGSATAMEGTATATAMEFDHPRPPKARDDRIDGTIDSLEGGRLGKWSKNQKGFVCVCNVSRVCTGGVRVDRCRTGVQLACASPSPSTGSRHRAPPVHLTAPLSILSQHSGDSGGASSSRPSRDVTSAELASLTKFKAVIPASRGHHAVICVLDIGRWNVETMHVEISVWVAWSEDGFPFPLRIDAEHTVEKTGRLAQVVGKSSVTIKFKIQVKNGHGATAQ